MTVQRHTLPEDAAVREQALDPVRSFIVEAPAGSGKTELLTRRYLRLLATVRAPEEILAITFTRKAAAEMRARVLKALALADRDAAPEDALAREVWSLARAVTVVDTQQGWDLQAHPARLRIMTIDAFNNYLARQLPILSGAGAALSIAQDAASLYADVALRLAERLSGDDEDANAIAQLLRHLDNRYDVFESLLSQELARREHWLDLGLMRFDMPSLRQRLQAALRTVVEAELTILRERMPRDAHDELVELATHAAAVLNGVGDESAITACDALTSMPAASAASLPQWRGLAELLLTKEGAWRAQVNRRIGIPPEHKAEKQRLQALLARLESESDLADALHLTRALPPDSYDERQWRTLTALLAVLKLAIAELEVVMRERGEADYVANAIAARRALGSTTEPTDLALRLDYRLKHLLMDEFQDTSRGQVELLASLTAGWSDGDGRTLFCVGDPMQSIYRFRHADVGLFLNLKRHGLNQLRLTPLRLTVNFRSSAPVLNWINATFAQTLPRHDDPDRGAVKYTASAPHARALQEGGVFVHALIGDKPAVRMAEAQQIGELIERTQAATPNATIAVLASNRLHLQWTIRELRLRHIPFQAVDIDPLARRPAILDLVALTRALTHLADRTAWLSILRAPWCGLSLADLHALCASAQDARDTRDAGTAIWQLLNDTARRAALSEHGQRQLCRALPILESALAVRGRMGLRDCVERAWHALGGPATLASEAELGDTAAFFARLERIERNGDLEDSARLEEQLGDLYAIGAMSAGTTSDERNPVTVELMTIHRAKGLEFDVVILPALDAGSRADEPPLLRAQELPQVEGEKALLLAPIAASGTDKNAIYAWLESMEKDRARFEKGRLLYVAATRAERELHLFGAVKDNAEKDSNGALGKPTANTFLSLLWPAVEAEFVAHGAIVASSVDTQTVQASSIRTRRLPLTWQPPLPAGRVEITASRDVIENEPLHPEFEWVGETARHIGTLVHREIERLARLGLDRLELDRLPVEKIASQIASHRDRYLTALAELGVPPHLREAAAIRVIEALARMLGDERGRWLLAGEGVHREAASEFALSGVIGADIVNGVIDRTFVTQDGVRWVVDFKTSMHEGGGLDAFLDNEVERYRLQLSRYVRLLNLYRPDQPIKAALYFPLLGAWREVIV